MTYNYEKTVIHNINDTINNLTTYQKKNDIDYMILGNIVIQYIDTQHGTTTTTDYPGGKYPYYKSKSPYPTIYSVIATPYATATVSTNGLIWYTVNNILGLGFSIISNLNQSTKTGYNQYYVLIISSL